MTVPDGLVLIDKPSDWTSFDVVNKVRSVLVRKMQVKPRAIKVGHSGTLDPAATGLLVLAIGSATKRINPLTKLDKTYEVEATLGASSDTGDKEGRIIQADNVIIPEEVSIIKIMNEFTGDIMQSPHRYSAVKINGVRAYKLARRGQAVDIKPRKVVIYDIYDIEYDWPIISFTARVSSGTYIRTLVEDIGEKLETGGYTSSLRRTRIGDYNVSQAISVTNLTFDKIVSSISPLD